MDASEVLLQPVAEQNTEPVAEPVTVVEGAPDPDFDP
jgi:hypothetical protein